MCAGAGDLEEVYLRSCQQEILVDLGLPCVEKSGLPHFFSRLSQCVAHVKAPKWTTGCRDSSACAESACELSSAAVSHYREDITYLGFQGASLARAELSTHSCAFFSP